MVKKLLIVIILSAIIFAGQLSAVRHYALLSNGSESGGPQGTADGTDLNYDYLEEDNQLVLSRMFSQSWHWSDGGHFYDPLYQYNVEHLIYLTADGTNYQYTYRDSTNTVRYRHYYTLNTQNKLTYSYYDNNGHFLKYRKLYFSIFDSPDSIYYSQHYNNSAGYNKHIFSHDTLGRIVTDNYFTSYDSLNWTANLTVNVFYGNPLGYDLKFDLPELHDLFLYEELYDNSYQVDSIRVHEHNGNYNYTRILSSEIYPDHINIIANSGSESYNFNLLGYLISLYDNYDPWGGNIYYTWGDYTHNQDELLYPIPIKAYPNPFDTDLNIVLNSNKSISNSISIYNIKGQLIHTWKDVKSTELVWDGKDLNNNSVSPGVYIIRARQGKQVMTTKVIKL